MKKNSILFLLLILSVSCTQKKEHSTFLSLLSKSNSPEPVLERKLASSKTNKCFGDIFTLETLKESVKNEEKRYASGKTVTGKWKHLDLSKLSIPQANFLKSFGDKIGDKKNPESIDYSSCDSVPCIYNKIYGKEDHVAGYVHYLWYLKFGNMLSADNMVPDQVSNEANVYNGKTYQLADYLYTDDELYGMWRLIVMLEKSHTFLTKLTEVQRLPRGSSFEGKPSNVCGVASSGGWINLQDACVAVSSYNRDAGYLYQAVTHEINHQIDYQQAAPGSWYRSQSKDYLDLVGWNLKEFRDEKTGQQIHQWELLPGSKLITSYAYSSPAESFAEDLAVYRHNGDDAKRSIKDSHYEFIGDNYYQKRKFDSLNIVPVWLTNSAGEVTKEAFRSIVDCTQKKNKFKTTYLVASDFSKPILPSLLSCLSVEAEDLSQRLKAKFSLSEPEGCNIINGYSLNWDIAFKKNIVALYEKYISEMEKDKTYLANIQKFYDQLSDPSIALNSYVSCYAEKNEEECFQLEVEKEAFESAQKLGVPDSHAEELATLYSNYHSYLKIKLESEKVYGTYILSNKEIIREESENLWQSCRDINHNDDAQPTGSSFQVTNGYMVSSFYNCLNAQFSDSMKNIVREFSIEGRKIENGKEELILSKGIKSQLSQSLEEQLIIDRNKELTAVKEQLANDNGAIRKQVLSSFSWISNVVNSESILKDCIKVALVASGPLPKFHQRKELYGEYIKSNVCVGIESSPEFSSWLANSKEEFVSKAYSSLEVSIQAAGNAAADNCLKKYPADTNLNRIKFKKEREECLATSWIKVEQEELKRLESDPMVKKFSIDVNGYKEKLESNRRRLQLKVIKEKF